MSATVTPGPGESATATVGLAGASFGTCMRIQGHAFFFLKHGFSLPGGTRRAWLFPKPHSARIPFNLERAAAAAAGARA